MVTSGVQLGRVNLSGKVTVATQEIDSYIAEHPVPNMEGGRVERLGSSRKRITLHGFVLSGILTKDSLTSLVRDPQLLYIGSHTSGQVFYSGYVSINDIFFTEPAGRAYSLVHFRIGMTERTVQDIGAFQADTFQNDAFQVSGIA